MFAVPIHSDPSGNASKEAIVLRFRSGVFEPLNTVKFAPSKRASPSLVPNQRYPSAVCAMARMESCGNPFDVVQTSWPNCVSASLGFNPHAGTDNRPTTSRLARRSVTTPISAKASRLYRAAPIPAIHRQGGAGAARPGSCEDSQAKAPAPR